MVWSLKNEKADLKQNKTNKSLPPQRESRGRKRMAYRDFRVGALYQFMRALAYD